jgi:hypothetical protein
MTHSKLVLTIAGWTALALCTVGCGIVDPTGTVSVESESSTLTTSLRVNCGGPAISPFGADTEFKGGNVLRGSQPVDTSQALAPAPAAVYQTARVGNFSYAFSGFPVGTTEKVRLHFAETKWAVPGARVFDVAINGTPVLTRFDIVKAAGAKNVAVVKELEVASSATGAFEIKFTSVHDKSLVSGIEILASAANGTACTAGSQCASGNCVDGVCCNVSRCGSCQACNVPGAVGVCRNVPVGTPDPSGVCVDQGAASCGTTGRCDGMGGCQLYAAGTVCSAPSCPPGSSSLTTQGTCTGVGACQTFSTTCFPYVCGATNACGFSCTSDADCAPPALCNVAIGTCS